MWRSLMLIGHAKLQRWMLFFWMFINTSYRISLWLILHFSSQGGQIAKYTALLATGNYHGVVGFAKAKGPTAKIAIQRVWISPVPNNILNLYLSYWIISFLSIYIIHSTISSFPFLICGLRGMYMRVSSDGDRAVHMCVQYRVSMQINNIDSETWVIYLFISELGIQIAEYVQLYIFVDARC